jgi:hypothetical protein
MLLLVRVGRNFRVLLLGPKFFSFSTCAPVKLVRLRLYHETVDIFFLVLIFILVNERRYKTILDLHTVLPHDKVSLNIKNH